MSDTANTISITLASATATNRKSNPLRMPREVRNMIWEYVLTQEEEIVPSLEQRCLINALNYMSICYMEEPVKETVLSLTRVCRSINAETSTLYYQLNKFRFYQPRIMQRYLSVIGLDNRRQIRDLTFGWAHQHLCTGPAFMLLKDCTNLRKLKAFVWSNGLNICSFARWNRDAQLEALTNLKLFRQLRVAHPEKFQFTIEQPKHNFDIFGVYNEGREKDWGPLRESFNGEGGLDWTDEVVLEFQNKLMEEITQHAACEVELSKRRVPEQYAPGTRYSRRTYGKQVNYVEVEEEDTDLEENEGEFEVWEGFEDSDEEMIDETTPIETEDEMEMDTDTQSEEVFCEKCFSWDCDCVDEEDIVREYDSEMYLYIQEACLLLKDGETHEKGCCCLTCISGDDL